DRCAADAGRSTSVLYAWTCTFELDQLRASISAVVVIGETAFRDVPIDDSAFYWSIIHQAEVHSGAVIQQPAKAVNLLPLSYVHRDFGREVTRVPGTSGLNTYERRILNRDLSFQRSIGRDELRIREYDVGDIY